MSWAEAKWTVDSLLQKIGQAPNNMRNFIQKSSIKCAQFFASCFV